MKMLITGAAGMLGSALVPALASAGHEVQPTDIDLRNTRPWSPIAPSIPEMTKLDVRSRDDIAAAVAAYRPEFIVHLAAETDVEICDQRPDHAWETNALGTKHVALAALDANVPLAY